MPIIAGRMNSVDVAVVGAGAAGLAAARRILGSDRSMLVLEAGARIGGRAHTVTPPAAGVPLDLGCFWLHGARGNAWRAFAETHGFEVDRTPAPWLDERRWLHLGKGQVEDLQRTQATFYDRVEEVSARERPMGEFIDPDHRWRGLLDAISTFVSGAELDRVAARDHADYAPGDTLDWRVPAGYGRLITSAGAGVPVMLETAVTGIDMSRRDRLLIETTRGTLEARAAIVTVSTDVLAAGTIRFTPALPEKLAAAAKLPLGLADKLFLRLDRPEDVAPETHRLGTHARARTGAYHIRPFGRPIIECFYGGQLARDLEAEGPAAFTAFAFQELATHFGSDFKAGLTPLCTTAWAAEPFIRGSYAYAVPGSGEPRAVLAAPVEDRLFFAGEACSAHKFTTAHGAYETGVAAAEAAIEALSS